MEERVEDMAEILLLMSASSSNISSPPSVASSASEENTDTQEEHSLVDNDHSSAFHSPSLPETSSESGQVSPQLEEEEAEEQEDYAFDDEDEDFYFEDEDDEEFQAKGSSSKVTKKVRSRVANKQTPSKTPATRTKRKKAPSGSACEKHKRWKKRCPDDCPGRKGKFRNVKKTTPGETESQTFHQETSSSSPSLAAATSLSPSSSSLQVIKDESKATSSSSSTRKKPGRKTAACERHTLKHSKCPPNCPDRRPIVPKNSKTPAKTTSSVTPSKRSETSTRNNGKNEPIESKENCQINALDNSNTPISTRTRKRSQKMTPIEPVSTPTKRTKYLPKSCDFHRMLHAKCDIDCPNRIMRDKAEQLKNKSRNEVHWKKKMAYCAMTEV